MVAQHRFRVSEPLQQTAGDGATAAHAAVGQSIEAYGLKCPDLIDQLGLLDDAVFESIAGRPGALERLRLLWPQVKLAVGAALVEESREQYVRHALTVWRKCVAGAELHDPATAVAAMEVVSLLFDE